MELYAIVVGETTSFSLETLNVSVLTDIMNQQSINIRIHLLSVDYVTLFVPLVTKKPKMIVFLVLMAEL